MYYSWCILGWHWDVCIVAGITGLSLGCMYYSWYIMGCHCDVCIIAGVYWAGTGMYVL